MISIKELRKNKELFERRLASKQDNTDLSRVLILDGKLRDLKTKSNEMRAERNAASESIGQFRKKKVGGRMLLNTITKN